MVSRQFVKDLLEIRTGISLRWRFSSFIPFNPNSTMLCKHSISLEYWLLSVCDIEMDLYHCQHLLVTAVPTTLLDYFFQITSRLDCNPIKKWKKNWKMVQSLSFHRIYSVQSGQCNNQNERNSNVHSTLRQLSLNFPQRPPNGQIALNVEKFSTFPPDCETCERKIEPHFFHHHRFCMFSHIDRAPFQSYRHHLKSTKKCIRTSSC